MTYITIDVHDDRTYDVKEWALNAKYHTIHYPLIEYIMKQEIEDFEAKTKQADELERLIKGFAYESKTRQQKPDVKTK